MQPLLIIIGFIDFIDYWDNHYENHYSPLLSHYSDSRRLVVVFVEYSPDYPIVPMVHHYWPALLTIEATTTWRIIPLSNPA